MSNDVTVPPQVHLNVRIVRMTPLYRVGPTGFSVVIEMVCERCGERGSFAIQGHHVRTFHRIFGDVAAQYPEECEELMPTDTKPTDKAKVM